MSSLSLLNSVTPVNETSGIACTPAVAVLLIGAVVVLIDIVNENPGRAGYRMMITFGLTLILLLLCLMGFGHISYFLVLLPFILIGGMILIIVMALMIGKREPEPEPIPSPASAPIPDPDQPCHRRRTLDQSYRYVMTGKGFYAPA
jgi:hypothetical protein